MKKRIISFILVLATLASVIGIVPMTSHALPTVYQQGDSRWGSKTYGGITLAASGCGILSTVNAVNYLTGNFIPPTDLAQWGYNNNYFNGSYGQGTVRATFYANVTAAFGGTYGFKVHDQTWGKVSNSKLINHLVAGGAAIVHCPNHFMAICAYNTSTGQYLVYDSAANLDKRWTTTSGTWLTAAQIEANANITVDWFCLVSRTSTPTPSLYTVTTSVASGQGSVHLGNGVTSAQAQAGQVVNFQVTPASGYKATQILVGGTAWTIQNNGEDYVYQFTMPAGNCGIVVTFAAKTTTQTLYTVTASVTAGSGSVHFGNGVTSAQTYAGTVVNYQVTPASGYVASKILVGGTSVAIQNGGEDYVYQFTMPSGNCAVQVEFTQKTTTTYSVTTSVAAGSGTVTLSNGSTSASYAAGSTVKYTVTPASGYKVTKIVIYGTSQTILNGGATATYEFPMEAYAATIAVTFTATTYKPGVYTINEASLNVRTAPTNGTILGALTTGDRITAVEIVDTFWAKFIYKGQIAYVSVHEAYATYFSTTTIAESDMIFDQQAAIDWVNASGVASTTVSLKSDDKGNTYMQVVADASNDPQMNMNFAAHGYLNASDYKYMVVTARTSNTANALGGMFLCAGSVTGPTPDSYAGWQWNADGSWHDYVIDLSGISAWSGNASLIRFDYFEGTTAAGATLDIRSIKFYTSKPTTAAVTTNKTSYTTEENVTVNFSGLGSYLGTLQNQTPFVAIYAADKRPGTASAIMYTYIDTSSGSVSFPNDAFGGTSIGLLPAGSYKAWIAYDANGSLGSNNFNNSYYAGADTSYAFTVADATPTLYKATASVASGSGTVHFGDNVTSGDVAPGTTVNYQVTPASGYKVTNISVGGNAVTIQNNGGEYVYQFTMPEKDCAVVVTFTKIEADTSVVDKVGTDIASGSNSAVIKVGTTASSAISALQTKLNASSVTITKDGVAVSSTAVIATGMVVTSGSTTYTIVVKGDVDCDGEVTIDDAAAAMAGLRGTTTLSSASKDAAKEVSGKTGALSILDIMALLKAL